MLMDNTNETLSTVSVSQSYSGPIPPASELVKYNQACPDAADRIIRMAENEAKHRHEMQSRELKERTKVIITSMLCAVVCVAILGGVIVYAIHEKQTSTAIATSITAIAAVAGIFFWYKKKE